ncbi:MAG TPA: tRNA (adenosine(37)-N6)-threonylcarbamoyltransferase complex transferase subunit TsaD [Chloroflexia bacterium]|nr:tRNA (adenosine(37)-N6)-threonylcarbamoyltransferase complex transferase subunit TsaD [Chloroflexia bacterium]
MNILSIETSCDETSVSLVRNGRHILANVIASQIPLHQKYGGVVPELASRQHVVTIVPVLAEAMKRAQLDWPQVDAIAVTKGPGLSPALLVGVNSAKALAFARHKPLLGVNHMEGHIYSNWLIPEAAADDPPPEPQFPLLNLIVSGGHSELVLMTGHGQYRMLGKTVDDAAGEAFDKAARILGLGYPGGPAIQRASEGGDPARFQLPRAWLKGTYDFSFSGLKTALLRKVQEYGVVANKPVPWQKQEAEGAAPPSPAAAVPIVERELPVADLAASFQAALVDALVEKTVAAAAEYGVREVLVAGGVAANASLRSRLKERLPIPFRYPPIVLCTDNAAMIAAAAHYRYEDALQHDLSMDIEPSARYV